MTGSERLEALAALLAAGRSPKDALGTLERVGGGAAVWSRQIAQTAAPRGLGPALAQHRVLDRGELAGLGGPVEAGSAEALAWVVHRRRTLRERARTLWPAMALPGLLAAATAGATWVLGVLVGASTSLVLDLLPLAVIAGAIAVATLRPLGQLRSFFGSLPPFNALRRHDAEAELAAVVAATPETADGFAAAAKWVPEHRAAAHSTAARLRDGSTLEAALPTATAVGERLALRLAVGAAEGDLRAPLREHARSLSQRATRQAAWAVRIATYLVLVWVSVRSTSMLTEQATRTLVPGMQDATKIDPAQQKQLDELMRELGL